MVRTPPSWEALRERKRSSLCHFCGGVKEVSNMTQGKSLFMPMPDAELPSRPQVR